MLTPRLECIVKYVDCGTAADIGTDHAYVPIELIKSGRAKKVIAADIRQGPLSIAAANIAKHGMEDKIETRLGGGISVLAPGEAEIIIIAGMGGELIADILRVDIGTARGSELVLQPMNSQYELRKWLIENEFTITAEDIESEEHHVYNIMTVRSGRQEKFKRDIDYHIPPLLYENKKLRLLYEKKEREFEKIINGLSRAGHGDAEKLEYYKNAYEELKELRKYAY